MKISVTENALQDSLLNRILNEKVPAFKILFVDMDIEPIQQHGIQPFEKFRFTIPYLTLNIHHFLNKLVMLLFLFVVSRVVVFNHQLFLILEMLIHHPCYSCPQCIYMAPILLVWFPFSQLHDDLMELNGIAGQAKMLFVKLNYSNIQQKTFGIVNLW
jgi:hypothetical protein